MKKTFRKIFSGILVFAALFGCFTQITRVFAYARTETLTVTFRSGENEEGIVQYSLDDGSTWNDIISNISQAILASGNGLRIRIVPNENKEVDYAGVHFLLDNTDISNVGELGLDDADGYTVDPDTITVELSDLEFRDMQPVLDNNTSSNVSLRVTGEELEYNQPWSDDASDFVFGINNSDMKRFAKDEVNYIYENSNIVGLESKGNAELQYNREENQPVTFHIRTQWNDIITSIIINGVSYSTPQTKDALISAFSGGGIGFDIENVPYAENYVIEVEGRKQNENEIILGNFGWTYDPNTNEFSDDDKIPNGTLEFVEAKYNNHTYTSVEALNAVGGVFNWKSANKDNDPYGEARLAVGTELTIRLVPDKGYQLTELTLNGFPFTPGEEPGLYTFTIGGGNWHLGANFAEVGNEVDATASSIKNGNINLSLNGDDSFVNGTAKLEVKNMGTISQERTNEFVSKAETDGYEIDSYLDMSLYNTIYKGGKKDINGKLEAWDTQVDNVVNNASITLELNEDMANKQIVLVHETHEGNTITGYEFVEATYNESDNTITFETNSFSNYAIAVKNSTKVPYNVDDENGNLISFKAEPDHSFNLNIINWTTLTDEELEEKGMTRDEFNEGYNLIKELTKDSGEMIAFFQIEVTDEDDNQVHNGPFQIRIKMTDEMKKYNTFKLTYVDTDNGFELEDPITLTRDGDYLVGTLPHLSTYALNVSDVLNPKTGDNLMLYISILGISIIGFIASALYMKKRNI